VRRNPVLDLVNTLDNRFRADGPTELLPDYAALLRFMEQTQLLDATRPWLWPGAPLRPRRSDRSIPPASCAKQAASTLYATAEGSTPRPADVRKLVRYLQSARQRQELVWVPSAAGTKFSWDWGASQSHADLPVWILSLQASALLTSEAISRLRTCGCETCRWLFSRYEQKSHTRWCDMKVCGNRMKARRFQARRRENARCDAHRG